MLRFIMHRLMMLVVALFGISVISFGFIHVLPGNPLQALAGSHVMTPERTAVLMAKFGLDKPLWYQYGLFIKNALHGDLGASLINQEAVSKLFFEYFPATVELSFFAIIFAVVIGLPAGVFAALKRGTAFDHTVMGISLTGFSMPIFWWGLLLIILFSVNLGWTPVAGRIGVMYYVTPITGFMTIDTLLSGQMDAFWSAVQHLILPTIVLGTIPMAIIARQTRAAMLEVLQEDYIRTAKAKGLSSFQVIGVHAFRNAMVTVVTVVGLQLGYLMAGAVLTETTFGWPGIANWMVHSIFSRDYPCVQGGLLIISSLIVVVNFLVDVIYGFVNPRVMYK